MIDNQIRCASNVAEMAIALCLTFRAEAQSIADLKNLSIEVLTRISVSSVTKTSTLLGNAPTAIYVITQDDIVRSGATNIPEALRLAPNLQVAQTSASKYVITARGMNGSVRAQSYANKLLVLIDGRSVYTPLFSGVYWDIQDVVLADVDRIEVISGPGATLWGANAMNGVINIITRRAFDTQGLLVDATAGDREATASLRYGGTIGSDVAYRLYAKAFREASTAPLTAIRRMIAGHGHRWVSR